MWLELEGPLLKARQDIESDARLDTQMQVAQAIAELQQETAWIKRLHVGCPVQIKVANEWFHGNVQHACEKSVVLLDESSIRILNTDAVHQLADVESKISTRQHSEYRCWNSVLQQVHDVKVLHQGQFLVGSVALVNVDAFDLDTCAGRLTLPWKQVSYVHISL